MPADENLWAQGCVVVSVCSLCGQAAESTNHLFLDCIFARRLWGWLSSAIHTSIDLSSFQTILALVDRSWSDQMHDVITATIINVIWGIWHCRNQARFQNKNIPLHLAINVILAIYLAGNASTGSMSSLISKLVIMRSLGIQGHPLKASIIKQVIWYPPYLLFY